MSYMHIKELKKDMVIYECEGGRNIKMTIKGDTVCVDGYYTAVGVTDKGTEIPLTQLVDTNYHLSLYAEPQYIRVKNGVITYNNIDV